MEQAILISEKDNVAVALRPLEQGATVNLDGCQVTALENIPQGHKISVRPIGKGKDVVKYGFPIGHATKEIAMGSWVHTHNMATNLSGEQEYSYEPESAGDAGEPCPGETLFFQGFGRGDGKAGVRNEIWVIPAVGCVNDIAKQMVRENQDLVQGSIDGLYAFPHPFGCSQTGADHAQTRKLLAALAQHPNAGAVLVLSLGCENLTQGQFKEELGDYEEGRIKFLTCQEVEDELAEGRKLLQECAAYAGQFHRTPIPINKLVVGMKCGASDGLSGITANPAVGRFSDLLVAQGGRDADEPLRKLGNLP